MDTHSPFISVLFNHLRQLQEEPLILMLEVTYNCYLKSFIIIFLVMFLIRD